MKTIALVFLLLISLEFISCSKQETPPSAPSYTIEKVRSFAYDAARGDRNANDSLAGLIDTSLPLNDHFNNVDVQAVISSSGKQFYTVLLEYPNPVYNRFAIYDAELKPLLADKSLNGRLLIKEKAFNGKAFLELKEEFLSKDILELSRLTLYSLDDPKIVFRGYSRLITPRNTFLQTISEVSNDRIRTDIISLKRSDINGKSDVFTYDGNLKMYISNENLFEKLVKDEVSKIKNTVQRPEITDEKSALQSTGLQVQVDSIPVVPEDTRAGYSISLDEGWRELKDISISSYTKKNLKGNKYLNSELGASFMVAEISQSEKAEDYLDYTFLNVYEGLYKVRFTDKIETTKYFYQYFEFSCGTKKYLLIFEASKYTYDKYKKIYERITNSFTMDC